MDSFQPLVQSMVAGVKNNIESAVCDTVTQLGGGVEGRITGEAEFVSAQYGFLIDDLNISHTEEILQVLKKKIIIICTVRLFSAVDHAHMHQAVAHGHEVNLLLGNLFCLRNFNVRHFTFPSVSSLKGGFFRGGLGVFLYLNR